MNFIYPLVKCPASYDFLVWLAACTTVSKGSEFNVTITKASETSIFRPSQLDVYRKSDLEQMLYQVMLPACELFPVKGINLFSTRKAEHRLVSHMGTVFTHIGNPYSLKVPEWAKQWVTENIDRRSVVMVLRECRHHPKRNSNKEAWLKAANEIRQIRPVIILGDTWGEQFDYPFIPLALRAALYEHVWCVLGVNGGTMSPAWHNSRVKYVTYKPVVEGVAACGLQDYIDRGFKEGGSWFFAGVNQYYQWGDDSYENIMDGYKRITADRGDGEKLLQSSQKYI